MPAPLLHLSEKRQQSTLIHTQSQIHQHHSTTLLPATVAAHLLRTDPTTTAIDARHASLHALERIKGSLCRPSHITLPSNTRLLIVYDAGTSVLSHPSRALDELQRLSTIRPHTKLALLCGGFPAFKQTAPDMLLVQSPLDITFFQFSSKQKKLPFVQRAIAAAAAAAKPPAAITNWLYVGPSSAVSTIHRMNVNRVIIVAEEFQTTYENLKTLRFPIQDYNQFSFLSFFPAVVAAIEQVKQSGDKCLVHCYAGASRSVAAVAAYLIWCGQSATQALDYVTSLHPSADPNDGFIQQLNEWELQVRKDMHSNIIQNFSNIWKSEQYSISQPTDDEDENDQVIVEVDRPKKQIVPSNRTHRSMTLTKQKTSRSPKSPQASKGNLRSGPSTLLKIQSKKKKPGCHAASITFPESPVTPCIPTSISVTDKILRQKRDSCITRNSTSCPHFDIVDKPAAMKSLFSSLPEVSNLWDPTNSEQVDKGEDTKISTHQVKR